MGHAQGISLPAGHLDIRPRQYPRVAALRWFAGIYFLFLGTSLIIMPQGTLGPWLEVLWLRGASAVMSGLVLLWVGVTAPSLRTTVWLHVVAAAPHLVIGLEYAQIGAYTPAATLLFLTVGVLVMPLVPAASQSDPARPDILGIILGASIAAQGLDLLLRPGAAIMVPPALAVPVPVVGWAFTAAGLAVVVAQLAPRMHAAFARASHVFAGGLILALWAAQSALNDPIYWVLGAAAVVRGLAVLTLPWWSTRIARFDPKALQVRLALALITATLVPLTVVLPVVLSAFEQRRVEHSLSLQQRAADIGALLVAEHASAVAAGGRARSLEGPEADVVRAELMRVPAEAGTIIGLVGEDGALLSSPQAESALPDLEALWRAGARPGGEIVSGPWGLRLIAAAPVPQLPWRVITILPQNRLLADLVPLRQLAFAAALVTVLAAGAAGWWLAGWLSAPIRSLTDGVERIAEGERGVLLCRDSPTELASLSAAVDTMAAALDARLSERDRLVAQLQAQYQELREHEQAREESIRALSHDLRNPLTALHGNTQRLARFLVQPGLEREARISQTIVALSKRLNAMIEDLADALRVDAGGVHLRQEEVHLPTLVASLRPHLGGPEQVARIELLVPVAVPPVLADPHSIERALTNLLSNGLKYSPPESLVQVRIEPIEGEVVVAISDRGVGITPEEQEQLFRRYYRAESAKAMSSGLGLGLYVTRALVEAHGGRIWVESRPGAGSTFHFTLPLAAESAPVR